MNPSHSVKPLYYVQAPPLPAGWEIRLDPSGKPYYVDHIHKTTTFTHPLLATRNQHMQPTTTSKPGNDLPPGWEMKQDSEGKDYYIDHNTKTTSYYPPTVPLEPQATEASPNDVKVMV